MNTSIEELRNALPYRPCVGIMVLNKAGKVWAGHRIKVNRGELSTTDKLWQMPQGGIDDGEEPFAAAKRELWEETGITSISLLAEASEWIVYDLPDELIGVGLKGKYRGQRMAWYAFRFEGGENEVQINPPPGDAHAEFDAWEWLDMHELPERIVPFKRGVYTEVVRAFSHLID